MHLVSSCNVKVVCLSTLIVPWLENRKKYFLKIVRQPTPKPDLYYFLTIAVKLAGRGFEDCTENSLEILLKNT
jgi:hypothetical protein